jgi:hypothetical protein
MLKKSIAVVFAIALAMTASVASAQTCSIAIYADPAGNSSTLDLDVDVSGLPFTVYIVMFAEDTVNAAAYKLVLDGYDDGTPFPYNVVGDLAHPDGPRTAGPNGTGLFIDEAGGLGTNVALGECVFGYGGVPVLVATYNMFANPLWAGGSARLEANPVAFPGLPSYGTCSSELKGCAQGPDLVVRNVVDNDVTSFGSIKSLYN